MIIPWRIVGWAAAGAMAVSAIAGGVAWYGSNKYDEGYAARDVIAVAAELEAAKKAKQETDRLNDLVAYAEARGKEREKKLQADATTASNAAGKLRDEIAGLRSRIPYLTEQAVRKYATTATVILGECNERYQSVAADADRFYSDRVKLEEAWPR